MVAMLSQRLTVTAAIEKLGADDPNLVTCDLANNAVLQLKTTEYVPKLAEALMANTKCRELILSGCGIDDASCEHLSKVIAHNSTLTSLNLEGNRCGNDGATELAKALATNRALIILNLLNQKCSRFGDSTLAAFTEAFDTNITLLKIVWRLESRQSFRLNKMLVRNNEIDRRIANRKDYSDLLPKGVSLIDAALVQPRSEASSGAPPALLSHNSGCRLRNAPPPPSSAPDAAQAPTAKSVVAPLAAPCKDAPPPNPAALAASRLRSTDSASSIGGRAAAAAATWPPPKPPSPRQPSPSMTPVPAQPPAPNRPVAPPASAQPPAPAPPRAMTQERTPPSARPAPAKPPAPVQPAPACAQVGPPSVSAAKKAAAVPAWQAAPSASEPAAAMVPRLAAAASRLEMAPGPHDFGSARAAATATTAHRHAHSRAISAGVPPRAGVKSTLTRAASAVQHTPSPKACISHPQSATAPRGTVTTALSRAASASPSGASSPAVPGSPRTPSVADSPSSLRDGAARLAALDLEQREAEAAALAGVRADFAKRRVALRAQIARDFALAQTSPASRAGLSPRGSGPGIQPAAPPAAGTAAPASHRAPSSRHSSIEDTVPLEFSSAVDPSGFHPAASATGRRCSSDLASASSASSLVDSIGLASSNLALPPPPPDEPPPITPSM